MGLSIYAMQSRTCNHVAELHLTGVLFTNREEHVQWHMDSERPRESGGLDHAASVFLNVRPRLFGIAYRMLGSAVEAEDIVQDVWIRWQATGRTVVLDAAAFLSTMTARLSINVLQSARTRRETYVGPW